MSENLEVSLVMGLIQLHSKIQKRVGGALSMHGIGLSEYLVLGQLYQAPQQKLRRIDLAEQVGLTPSGITRLLTPMEKIGMIEKEKNLRDARVSLVALTSGGRRIYEEVQVSFVHSSTNLFAPLDSQQQVALSTLIKALS